MGFYSDAKYGVVERVWFGGCQKWGNAYYPLTHAGSATTKTLVARYYPQGPIDVIKFGFQTVATASAPANATSASIRSRIPVELWKSSSAGVTRETLVASDTIKIHPVAATVCALWGIGSQETIASAEVEAGRFLTIFAATSHSAHGTAAAAQGTITASGSWRFFIDFVRRYDNAGRHEGPKG